MTEARVLVAVPYRVTTPRVLVNQCLDLIRALTYPQLSVALYPNQISDGRRFGANAIARNNLILNNLTDWHTHVLWLDADLVRVPVDLIERLLDVSERAIVAPFVFVERIKAGVPSIPNGGWFYDTGGFIDLDGHAANEIAPHFDNYTGGVIELSSVGCCYLVPAEIYRQGARYKPVGDEVEHQSFMRQARELGHKIMATDALNVLHAYLPKYGETWTHEPIADLYANVD